MKAQPIKNTPMFMTCLSMYYHYESLFFPRLVLKDTKIAAIYPAIFCKSVLLAEWASL
jgi:hypothetical protein